MRDATELEARVSRLEELVVALQQSRAAVPNPLVPDASDVVEAAPPGIVQYSGELELPTGGAIQWRSGLDAAAVLSADWSSTAHTLAALGHPERLEILRAVLHGVDTVAALVELLDTGTSGQVYHHIKELASAGWLTSAKRGAYAIPPQRIVPLLAIVLAASTPTSGQNS